MFNKCEIMKTAWRYNRNSLTRKRLNIQIFADALRVAWNEAKEEARIKIAAAAMNKTKIGYVSPEHLNSGDTIEVDGANGGYYPGNKVIALVEPAPLNLAYKAVTFTDGEVKTFPNTGTIKRVAIAA